MLTVQQVANLAELSPDTIRHYLKTATRARRNRTATARDLPAPVGLVDGANVWDPGQVEAWLEARKTPVKRGAIPKKEMQAVLAAANVGDLRTVITIARRNI